ncbi:MAG: protein-glutamate O-methyltransferase CheR [Magnetococcales bacterium]|nr:protein-glutamate O-methyltransferase CheR [Magnetococcales bacterium]NGZ27298.1 protein-glutamate O-methyltransferase CheR [Magnetococcales bacterium]
MTDEEVQDIEIQLVLEALRLRFGYDFRNYAPASLRRRVTQCLSSCEFTYISEIIPRLLHQGAFLDRLIQVLTISVSTLFRDPEVFRLLREHSVPMLRTYPYFNVWMAGCATGEEVYSMAILLKEAGIYDRGRIFATDINRENLDIAERGYYKADRWQEFENNYRLSGGQSKLEDYCHMDGDWLSFDPELKKNMVYSTHNLATDGVFAEMQFIVCRNVLIYFDGGLQHRVIDLFQDSLVRGGHLCLGMSENLDLGRPGHEFQAVSEKHRLFMAGYKRAGS